MHKTAYEMRISYLISYVFSSFLGTADRPCPEGFCTGRHSSRHQGKACQPCRAIPLGFADPDHLRAEKDKQPARDPVIPCLHQEQREAAKEPSGKRHRALEYPESQRNRRHAAPVMAKARALRPRADRKSKRLKSSQ